MANQANCKFCKIVSIVLFTLVITFLVANRQVSAFKQNKHAQNSSHNKIPLKPEEWAQKFTCAVRKNPLESIALEQNHSTIQNECRRDSSAWRFNYVDELISNNYKHLVRESSLDERLANSMYTLSATIHLDATPYKFDSGDHLKDLENERLVSGPKVDDLQCNKHLKVMLKLKQEIESKLNASRQENGSNRLELNLEEAHFRLARVLDSYGKFESGMLVGRQHAIGAYKQCISTTLHLTEQQIPARYCWAHMSLERHLSELLRHRRRFAEEGDNFKMMVAVCLPESCHSRSFNREQPGNEHLGEQNKELLQKLINTQYELPESMYQQRHLDLESVFCLVDEESKWAQLSLGGKLFIGLMTFWIIMVLFASLKRRQKHVVELQGGQEKSDRRGRRSFLKSLDLLESWNDFIGLNCKKHDGCIDLDVLNPIKILGCLTVIMAHAGLIMLTRNRDMLDSAAVMETGRFEMMYLGGFVIVDTFFVISGILITYLLLKKLNQRETSLQCSKDSNDIKNHQYLFNWDFFVTWIYVTLSRFFRIVPLFLVVFCFKKTIFNHLGSGPLWDWALNWHTHIGSCREESWLTPFTFISAYLLMGKQCLPPSWSLSNDLFFSLVVPPLIILFYKRPQLAKLTTTSLILLSSISGMFAYFATDPQLRYEMEQMRFLGLMLMLGIKSQFYTNPIYRIPAMLVGLLAGHSLFRYEQRVRFNKTLNHTYWPLWFRKFATPVAISIAILGTAMSLMILELRQALGPEQVAILSVFIFLGYHLIWSISNAIIFLRMLTDWKDSFWMQMSASRFFQAINRLNFALLLVHWDLIVYEANTSTSLVVFSRASYFSSFATSLFWSIPLSLFLHLFVETPVDKLVKTYLLKH